MSRRLWMRARLVAAIACGLVLVVVRPGLPHGALKSSSPKAGSHLAVVPRELRLTFTEAPELATASIVLTGPDSMPVALGPLTIPADSSTVLMATITGSLTAGVHRVAWRIAGKDGHPVRGTFSFVIAPGAAGLAGVSSPAAADTMMAHHDPVAMPVSPSAFDAESAGYVIIRLVLYAALIVVIGALVFRGVVLARLRGEGDGLRPSAARRASKVGAAAAIVLLAALAAKLVAQLVALHGSRATDLALVPSLVGGTTWGRAWLVAVAGALIALAGLSAGRRATDAGSHRVVTLIAALLLSFSPAFASHAASTPRLQPLAVAADGLHVLGASGWIGSLLVLVAAGIPAAMRLAPELRGGSVASLVEAFSPVALTFAAIAAATGVFAAWLHVGSLSGMLQSRYGGLLVAKLGTLAIVAGIGAYNWRRLKPGLKTEDDVPRLRRSASAEITLGLVVLAITAILVATPTPMDRI